eukprot:PhM_4_TR2329/c0_g1_i1/m.53
MAISFLRFAFAVTLAVMVVGVTAEVEECTRKEKLQAVQCIESTPGYTEIEVARAMSNENVTCSQRAIDIFTDIASRCVPACIAEGFAVRCHGMTFKCPNNNLTIPPEDFAAGKEDEYRGLCKPVVDILTQRHGKHAMGTPEEEDTRERLEKFENDPDASSYFGDAYVVHFGFSAPHIHDNQLRVRISHYGCRKDMDKHKFATRIGMFEHAAKVYIVHKEPQRLSCENPKILHSTKIFDMPDVAAKKNVLFISPVGSAQRDWIVKRTDVDDTDVVLAY